MGRGRRPRPAGLTECQRARVALKASRKVSRGKTGPLKGTLVLPYTLVRYKAAVGWFFDWMSMQGIEVPGKTGEFDIIVMEAIEWAWAEGEPRGLIGMCLSGLEYEVEGLRSQLRGSWKLWKHWGTQEFPTRVPPLSLDATMVIASHMWKWGQPEAALSILLAYHRFLRTSEFLKALVSHYLLPVGGREGHLLLSGTKTATNDSITFSDPLLMDVLECLVRRRKPSDLFIKMSPYQFRLLFSSAVRASGLSALFKPYSLRRGGASHFFRQTGNMARAMEVGRWRDIRTARIYINTALLSLAEDTSLSNPALRVGARQFQRVLEHFVGAQGN